MKRLALTFLLLCAACAAAHGQTTPDGAAKEEKLRDIRRLLELTRGAELGKQIVVQSLEQMRGSLAFLPDEGRAKVLKIFEEEMLKEFTQERMLDLVAPIYDEHLSAEDVKALIAFYETPTGRRLVDVLPLIVRESYEAGTARGREAVRRAMTRVAEEGLLTAPPAAGEPPKPAAKKSAPRKRRR